MTLLETINLINEIARSHENINNVIESGDIFELNTDNFEAKYSAFCATQNAHQMIGDSYIRFNFTLYYVDRLTASKDNKNTIQSTAVNVLIAIVNDLMKNTDINLEYSEISTFTQRFGAECAGGYITLGIITTREIC